MKSIKRMTIIFFVLTTMATVTLSYAREITLAWDPATGTVTGYKLYWGTQRNNYTHSLDVGDVTQVTLDLNLDYDTTYFFTITAYNSDGESGYSNYVISRENSVPDITNCFEGALSYVGGSAGTGLFASLATLTSSNQDSIFAGTGPIISLTGHVKSSNYNSVVIFRNGNWYVFNNTTNQWDLWLSDFGVGSKNQMLGDVNGDGLADAIVFFDFSASNPNDQLNGNWYIAPSNGTSFTRNSDTWLWLSDFGVGSKNQMLGDVNGDGLADAIVFFDFSASNPNDQLNGNWYIAPSNGTSFTRNSDTWLWLSDFGVGSKNQMLGNINEDGLAEPLVFYRNY